MVFPETLRLIALEFHSIINVSMCQEGKESEWGMFQERKEEGVSPVDREERNRLVVGYFDENRRSCKQ